VEDWGESAEQSAARAGSAGGNGAKGHDGNAPGGTTPAPLRDAEREPYLKAVLEAFEGGSLDAYEYTRRVRAIERASSPEELARAIERPDPGGEAAASASRPSYDAVDLARMMASPTGVRPARKSSRYTALIMVVLAFIVLLGIGIWLATRVHATSSGPSGAAVAPVPMVAYASAPFGPPSPLSSRR